VLDESPGPLGKGNGDATFCKSLWPLVASVAAIPRAGPCRAVYRASNAVDVIANCEIRALTGDI